MVWQDLTWFGSVWQGFAWFGIVWHCLAWFVFGWYASFAWFGTVLNGFAWFCSSHMPLPLPIEDNLRVVVKDGLPLADLAEEAALGGVVYHHPIDVAHLVLVVQPSVLGKGALLNLVPLDVSLVPFGGAVIARPPRLPVIHSLDILSPTLEAGGCVGRPHPCVRAALWAAPGLALAQKAILPPAAGQIQVEQHAAKLPARSLDSCLVLSVEPGEEDSGSGAYKCRPVFHGARRIGLNTRSDRRIGFKRRMGKCPF